jgi:hypothetical protein
LSVVLYKLILIYIVFVLFILTTIRSLYIFSLFIDQINFRVCLLSNSHTPLSFKILCKYFIYYSLVKDFMYYSLVRKDIPFKI